MLDYWKMGLALAVAALPTFLSAFYGYRKAKSLGINQYNIAEIQDRAAFRKAQMEAVESSQKVAKETLDQVSKLNAQVKRLISERLELTNQNIELIMRVKTLEVMVETCEKRLNLYERHPLP